MPISLSDHYHSFTTPMPGSHTTQAPQGRTLAFHLSLTVPSSAIVSSSEKQQKKQHAWERYFISAPRTPLPYSLLLEATLLFYYSATNSITLHYIIHIDFTKMVTESQQWKISYGLVWAWKILWKVLNVRDGWIFVH